MKEAHLTLRLPAELARALARQARAIGVPKSQLVREAVARYFAPSTVESQATIGVSARELRRLWTTLPRLSVEEATSFGHDIERSRQSLPPLESPWE